MPTAVPMLHMTNNFAVLADNYSKVVMLRGLGVFVSVHSTTLRNNALVSDRITYATMWLTLL